MGNGLGQAQGSVKGTRGSLQTGPLPLALQLGEGQGGVGVRVLPVPPGLWIPRIPSPPFLSTKLQAALKDIWGRVWVSPALCPLPFPSGSRGTAFSQVLWLEDWSPGFQGHRLPLLILYDIPMGVDGHPRHLEPPPGTSVYHLRSGRRPNS